MHVEVLENFGKLGPLGVTDQADKNLVRSASRLTALVALFVEQGVRVVCAWRRATLLVCEFGGSRFEACCLAAVELRNLWWTCRLGSFEEAIRALLVCEVHLHDVQFLSCLTFIDLFQMINGSR